MTLYLALLLHFAFAEEPTPLGATPVTPAPAPPEPAVLAAPPPAALAAPQPGAAPAALAATQPAAAPEADPNEAAFVARALTRGPVVRKDGAPSSVSWVVRTGAGHALGAVEFARTMNDNAGSERILAARRGGTIEAVLLASVGATLETIAIGFLIAGDNRSPRGEDVLWRGAALAGTGAMPLVACFLPARAVRDRERWPALYYTPEQADIFITAYNDRIRQELGLTAPAAPVAPPPAVAAPAPAAVEDAPVLPPVDRIPEAEPSPGAER